MPEKPAKIKKKNKHCIFDVLPLRSLEPKVQPTVGEKKKVPQFPKEALVETAHMSM